MREPKREDTALRHGFSGVYPTPVEHLTELSTPDSALWIKRDDLTHPRYGGNKVRKVERLLDAAAARGARSLVTVGAVGSNHVLTTGLFARERGMQLAAVVVAQPSTPHVLRNLRAGIALGIELVPASSFAVAGLKLAARVARGAYYLPAGGSNSVGAEGFVAAAHELGAQVSAGELPEPELLVVALGSGGTSGGLLAGLATTSLKTRILAVTVAEPPWFVERQALSLAAKCSKVATRSELARRIEFTRAYLGAGYGHPTDSGALASERAASAGLTLEPTYTAKAFAAALARVALGREKTILYWHTLSSAPLEPLLRDAPEASAIPPALARLAL